MHLEPTIETFMMPRGSIYDYYLTYLLFIPSITSLIIREGYKLLHKHNGGLRFMVNFIEKIMYKFVYNVVNFAFVVIEKLSGDE